MIYRVDLHVHTDASEGAVSSLDELVRAARRAGLDALVITDRDYCTQVPIEMRGILLIPGCEVTTQSGLIVAAFLQRPLDLIRLRQNGLPSADDAVLEIHRCGGLAILAQPYASDSVDASQFPLRPDAVETASARAAMHYPDANRQAMQWAIAHQRPQVGGSNAYSVQELGNAYTEISCPCLTRVCLKEALDLGHCRPILIRETSQMTCGYTDLTRARRQGKKLQIAKNTAKLGFCKLSDVAHTLRANAASRTRFSRRKK